MKSKDITKKLKEGLQDFNWIIEPDEISMYASVACACFIAGDNLHSDYYELDFSINVKKKIVDYLVENKLITDTKLFRKRLGLDETCDYSDSPIKYSDIDENFLDLVIKGLRIWKDNIDILRKGDIDEDQLIIIHPDWYLEDFEKDFKFITEDHENFECRLGIMSTKDWDFGKEELRDELNKNSCDSFAIWPFEPDDDSVDEDELEEAREELKKMYPNLDSITKVYNTDFD